MEKKENKILYDTQASVILHRDTSLETVGLAYIYDNAFLSVCVHIAIVWRHICAKTSL